MNWEFLEWGIERLIDQWALEKHHSTGIGPSNSQAEKKYDHDMFLELKQNPASVFWNSVIWLHKWKHPQDSPAECLYEC